MISSLLFFMICLREKEAHTYKRFVITSIINGYFIKLKDELSV